MKYKCLVFDHDDTVVNSTYTIHWPCFCDYLNEYFPGNTCSFEEYINMNFDPGFVEMCKQIYHLTDDDLKEEDKFWRSYVKNHFPSAYPGIKEIMEKQKAEGGYIAVVSHSYKENILRDYKNNDLPVPDLIYGWEQPLDKRKPSTFPLIDIQEQLALKSEDLLVIDDLKPGYDMAKNAGVDFAAAGWAYEIKGVKDFMTQHCSHYFSSVEDFADFLKETE